MNQEIRELNVLRVSDGSFVVRAGGSNETAPVVIKTYKSFPELFSGLESDLFSSPNITVDAPTTAQ